MCSSRSNEPVTYFDSVLLSTDKEPEVTAVPLPTPLLPAKAPEIELLLELLDAAIISLTPITVPLIRLRLLGVPPISCLFEGDEPATGPILDEESTKLSIGLFNELLIVDACGELAEVVLDLKLKSLGSRTNFEVDDKLLVVETLFVLKLIDPADDLIEVSLRKINFNKIQIQIQTYHCHLCLDQDIRYSTIYQCIDQ